MRGAAVIGPETAHMAHLLFFAIVVKRGLPTCSVCRSIITLLKRFCAGHPHGMGRM
jgi:hypothetical protein